MHISYWRSVMRSFYPEFAYMDTGKTGCGVIRCVLKGVSATGATVGGGSLLGS